MNRLEELTLKLLDATIDEAEIRELSEHTQSVGGQEAVRKLIELESHLRLIGRGTIAATVMERIEQARRDRVEDGVMQAVSEIPESVRPRPSQPGRRHPHLFQALLLGVAALAACLLLSLHFQRSQFSSSTVARLNAHGAQVRIVGDDGPPRQVPIGQSDALQSHDVVETSQATDYAEIAYTDGTRVGLLGETKVRITTAPDGSKQIVVLAGRIHADVSPQPQGRPLLIVTHTATLEVLGTTLGVEVRNASTQLEVAKGLVAMTRKADGQRVEVEAGRYATATQSANEPFQAHPFPDLGTEWSEDFEDGLPSGWRTGELVETRDGKSVRAVQSSRVGDGRFVVTSQNAWQEGGHGLCSIDENSVLHLRIKQSRFARITIMLGTRSYPPARGRLGGNLFYTRKSWNEKLPADTWSTISIPLASVAWHVKQGTKTNGPPKLDSLAAYLIHVTTMNEESGLVIDRLWITNDPPELH